MCIRTGNPGRPCLGSMAPGYDNSSKPKSKTPVADKLIEMKKEELRKNTMIQNYYYKKNGREDD